MAAIECVANPSEQCLYIRHSLGLCRVFRKPGCKLLLFVRIRTVLRGLVIIYKERILVDGCFLFVS